MAEKVILPEQTISGFQTEPPLVDALAPLEVGVAYTVSWDGTQYTCKAFEQDGLIYLGNQEYISNQGARTEPFQMAFVPAEITLAADSIMIMCAGDSDDSCGSDTHTVAIYQADEKIGIILKDYKGESGTYTDVEVVRVLSTTEGEMVHYVREDLIPEAVEKTVELDFSGGPMTVIPPTGQVFSKVSIPVPEGLASENIPEGVTIAGIPGGMATGGDNSGFSFGTFTYTGAIQTIIHGLGVVPDFIFIYDTNQTSGEPATAKSVVMMYGLSLKFGGTVGAKALTGKLHRLDATGINPTSQLYGWTTAMESFTGNACLHNVNENSFNVPAALNETGKYIWFAFSGLT